jgi:lipopolysaccharide exporter
MVGGSSAREPLARQTGSALLWRAIQLGGARAIALLRTLILARLLVPDDFGLLAIAWLTIEFAVALSEFGLREALIERPSPSTRDRDTAWSVELVRTCAVMAGILVAAPLIAALFGEPRATNLIRIIALSQVIDAFESIGVVDLTRSLRFRPQAIISLIGSVVFTVLAIALAPALGVWAVGAGAVAGSAAQVLTSYVVAPHRPRLQFDRAIARSLFRFGRWIYLMHAVAILGTVVLQATISRQLGAAALGVYFLSARLAFLPRDLLRRIIGDVLFPVHARLRAEPKRAGRMFSASVSAVWLVGAPIYVSLLVLAPSLVAEILGPEWGGAEWVIRVLALAALVGSVTDAAVPLLQGGGRPSQAVALVGIRSASVIVLAWALATGFGVVGAASAWLLAELVVLPACVAVVLRMQTLERPFAGIPARAMAIAIASIGSALIAVAFDRMLPGPLGVIAAGAAGVASMVALIWWLDQRFGFDLAEDVTQAFPMLARMTKR